MTNPFSETTGTSRTVKHFLPKEDGIVRPIWRQFCPPDHGPSLCGTLLAHLGQKASKVSAKTWTVMVMFKPMSLSCVVCQDGHNHKFCDRPWEWRRCPKVSSPIFTYDQVVVSVMSTSIPWSYCQWSSLPLVMISRLKSSSPKQLTHTLYPKQSFNNLWAANPWTRGKD